MSVIVKAAIITGGARGIGRAIAEQLIADGYAVMLADIRGEAAEQTAAELAVHGAVAVACQTDVTDPEACRAMVSQTVERLGRLDVLVNNAGISKPQPSLEVPPDDWRRMIDVQLNGVFFCSQVAGRQMVAQDWGGNIVNITSINAEAAFPERASYVAAKAGVAMLTQVLAVEWAEHDIRVNAVGPAHTETEMTAQHIRSGRIQLEALQKRIPLGRLASVADVANAVSFLVSDKASFITGQSLYVDGGYLAYGYL
jgi:NAD(P)-dependent dehydrogenase (short-subunit alcohol dehydrogenase family)